MRRDSIQRQTGVDPGTNSGTNGSSATAPSLHPEAAFGQLLVVGEKLPVWDTIPIGKHEVIANGCRNRFVQ
jgi:hypothetical protein